MSDESHEHKVYEDSGFVYNKKFQNAFMLFLYIACALSAIAGFVEKWQKKYAHFPVEEFPVFFAIYGFVMFALIVLIGQHLRKIVGRKEGYYDERE